MIYLVPFGVVVAALVVFARWKQHDAFAKLHALISARESEPLVKAVERPSFFNNSFWSRVYRAKKMSELYGLKADEERGLLKKIRLLELLQYGLFILIALPQLYFLASDYL